MWAAAVSEIQVIFGDISAEEYSTLLIKRQRGYCASLRFCMELRNSGNFATTHKIIADLQPYVQYLADEDYVDILLSALNNSQIMWLAQDVDVESFLKPIFDKYKSRLSIEQYNDFVNRTGWPNYRIKEPIETITLDDISF